MATNRVTKAAAAITVACLLGLAAWMAIDGGAEIALADVHAAMAEARTVRFDISWQWGSEDDHRLAIRAILDIVARNQNGSCRECGRFGEPVS